MSRIGVASDSTCDLSRELLDQYDIAILPLHILLDEKEYLDGLDITPEDIYEWSEKVKKTPKTSAMSPAEAEDFLKIQMEQYDELIFFDISESMSTSRNVMQMAAEELGYSDRVYVIDSMNLSTGIGLLVVKAAILAREAESAKEVVDEILRLRPRVRASFVVDTLTYLYRGGRCSGTAALIGSAIQLHPSIHVIDGKMQVGKKYRGRMDKVVINYVEDTIHGMMGAEKDRVFITHSGSDPEIVDAVRKQLHELGYFKEVLETRAGGVISSHCGPGTLGVLFIAGESK
ncbi:MAG: DegV family protein [Lachnospiraceae bacterium]|nr:DegV family protein [Lachnospiraceae bacterium]